MSWSGRKAPHGAGRCGIHRLKIRVESVASVDRNTYRLVQVQFAGRFAEARPAPHAARYTYLAPSDWRVAPGDVVRHPDMSQASRAVVCSFEPQYIDPLLPLKVLTERVEARAITVEVPIGYVVRVVPE